jgi:3-keto-disaccharide hydrolase
MVRSGLAVAAICFLSSPIAAQEPARPPVIGTWDLTLTARDGRPLPSWLEVHISGNGVLVGRFQGVVGCVRPISRLTYASDTLRFAIPPQWEAGSADLQFAAVLAGDGLAGTITDPSGTPYPFTAVRAPALRRATPMWGAVVRLFNGKDLTGWHTVGGTNEWSAVNGVLSNAKGGANLVTDAVFTDFKLHVEVKYPPRGNSGVYLRGRHEVQVEDSIVTNTDGEATGGLGAIYGFLIPNQNASHGAGKWEMLDVTLVGRRVTVVLNGTRIISDAEIPGPTGGALDSKEGAPGPIMLQGDHGPVEYRNLMITPAR